MADPVPIFIGENIVVSSGTIATRAAVAIGTPAADRRVVITLGPSVANNYSIVAGANTTIGGIQADVHWGLGESGDGVWTGCISAVVPTGTTADVSVEFSGTPYGNPYIFVWNVNDSEIGTPVVSTSVLSSAASTNTVNFSGNAGGCCIGSVSWTYGAKTPITVTGYTAESTGDPQRVTVFSASAFPTTGTKTATVNWSGTYLCSMGVIAWPPAVGGSTFYQSAFGAISFTGALNKLVVVSKAGAVSFTGVLGQVRTKLISLAGSLSLSGGLLKSVAKTLSGALPFAGALNKLVAVSKAGAVSFAGVLGQVRTKLISLAGSLSFSGGLSRQAQKVLAGALSISGYVLRSMRKSVEGGLALAGTAAVIRNYLSGAIIALLRFAQSKRGMAFTQTTRSATFRKVP